MGYIENISELCVGCGQCSLVCEVDAILLSWGEVTIDRNLCVLCETCVVYCPVEALVMTEGEEA